MSPIARTLSGFAAAILIAAWSLPVQAGGPDKQGRGRAVQQERGRGQVKSNGGGADKGRAKADKRDEHRWSDADFTRRVVIGYYDARGLPPGLAKRRTLPPGLARQVRVRGHLPPGLQSHLVPLPVTLERELPMLPPHYVRRFAGADLLVIDLRLNVVVSIFGGVLIR